MARPHQVVHGGLIAQEEAAIALHVPQQSGGVAAVQALQPVAGQHLLMQAGWTVGLMLPSMPDCQGRAGIAHCRNMCNLQP